MRDSGPLLQVLDGLVPDELHNAAWKRCSGAGWYFGHASTMGDGSAFWKLDLDSDAAFDAIWHQVRPRCEELAGTSLRVRRQYANGHTYGLGGRPHKDDGQFTLLYYPNSEWKDEWEGETVYYDSAGEIVAAIRPRPNRCVFFDASVLHAGRAPSRACPVLRVTVAYKLERVGASLTAPKPAALANDDTNSESFEVARISVEGIKHVYSIQIRDAIVERAVEERLAKLARSVRIPGFRPGEIPAKVLNERYRKQARSESVKQFAAEALGRALPPGCVPSTAELQHGAESGDLEIHFTAVCLPDLPPMDLTNVMVDRAMVEESTLQSLGITREAAAPHIRNYLKAQILDRLDAAYPFRVLPSMVEREFKQIWKLAQSRTQLRREDKAGAESELRAIAERRLRVGYIITEIARRYGIEAQQGAELEDKVVDYLAARARVQDRVVTEEELRELMQA